MDFTSMRVWLLLVCPIFSPVRSAVVRANSRTGENASTRSVGVSTETKFQFALAFTNGVRGAVHALAETEADLHMGADLGLDLGLVAAHGGDGGPATLAEYCSGAKTEQEKKTELKVGTRVTADWEGYGTHYPGKVMDENSNGTVDIHYDDGFTEDKVKTEDIKIKKKNSFLQEGGTRDDPACKLQAFLEKLKKQLKSINAMIAQWLGAQRAKVAGVETAPTPPPNLKPVEKESVAKAPSPAVPKSISDKATDELEKLKAQLAERDKFIEELEKQVAANEEALQKYMPAAPPAPAGVMSVDDLIAQYKAMIADRDNRIAELQRRLADQQAELARLSGTQLSLTEIDAAVRELEVDVAEAERKRDQLEADGELDPELKSIIDAIIKALKKLRSKVDNLMQLDSKANADREAGKRAELEAAEAARQAAKATGADPEEAAKAAVANARTKMREKIRAADLESMHIAQDVGHDLKEAEKGAEKLDTGLHPHGDKWWRYRYEHSYIEALLMIFISFLMLLWSEYLRHLKTFVYWQADEHGATPECFDPHFSPISSGDDDTHGTIYLTWLHFFAEQMMVCVFVFLTIWVISKTWLIDYAPMLIVPSDDMRVPLTGEEYRHLCFEICTIFFFAIVFYFCLMFSVARSTRQVTRALQASESKTDGDASNQDLSLAVGYLVTHSSFEAYLSKELRNGDPHMEKINGLLGGDFSIFPLGKYLTYNVRSTVPQLFFFGWIMWLPTICLFLTLMLLHRFAHMGYVRIMTGFAAAVLVLIIGMACLCKSMEHGISKDQLDSNSTKKTIHNRFNTESFILGLLQFCLFFCCYGVARMICQTWMWELHFWPVLCLTFVAFISVLLFIWFVAPTIPHFVAALAMPPFIDDTNWQQLERCAEQVRRESPRLSGRARP